MIVWTGWGFVVAFIAIIGVVVGLSVSMGHEVLGLALGMLVAAAGTYGFARLLGRRPDRLLIDPATNERVILRRGDSLFFVPVRFWTWIFVAFSMLAITFAIFRK